MPKPEIEEYPPQGVRPDLVQDNSNETVIRGKVQPVAEITLSTTEVLEMLMFEPTYVKIGALVVRVCREKEWYKVESEEKPESEDEDEQVENPTNETPLENVKTEEEAQMEIKESEKMPTPEIEENIPIGPDLVQDNSNEIVIRGQVQPVAEIALSSTEILKLLTFKPTYVKVGAVIFKVRTMIEKMK